MTTLPYVTDDPRSVRAGLLIAPMFEGSVPGPGVKALGLADAYAAAHLTGKRGQDLLVTRRRGDGFSADAVLLVGVGDKDEFTIDRARRASGRIAGVARRFSTVATLVPQSFTPAKAPAAAAACVEGLLLGAYRFTRYKTSPAEHRDLRRVSVVGRPAWNAAAIRRETKRAGVVAEAVNWARDLVNTPAGDLPPAGVAREAAKMARSVGLTCKVWNESQLAKGGFGGILGVGKGSANPPRLIELSYTGAGSAAPIALSGKGITFDSGGLSIKDAKGMESMKDDMSGAASVLATMKVIAQLKPKINVVAAIPCSENMPGGAAQRPGDVITHRGGTTSEVLNTDAEGRLVLADAIAYLNERKPQLIIDTATLTGACMIALGTSITGAMGNDDALARDVIAAGESAGEAVWQLPLYEDYRTLIDSSVADIKNVGERYAGAITAAWFLAVFAGDTPWLHLDIAGPAFTDRPGDLGPRGGTGVPTRTLVRFLLDRAERG